MKGNLFRKDPESIPAGEKRNTKKCTEKGEYDAH
jgi:hypothetical protein